MDFCKSNKEFKVLPKGNMSVNNSEAIRRVLLSGLGIGQLPTFIVGKDVQEKRLVPIMSPYALPVHAVYAVYPVRKHLPQKVSLFIEFLNENTAKHCLIGIRAFLANPKAHDPLFIEFLFCSIKLMRSPNPNFGVFF